MTKPSAPPYPTEAPPPYVAVEHEGTLKAIENLKEKNFDGFNKLSQLFKHYEIPNGFYAKMHLLSEYQLHFIIDDSGSMSLESDVSLKDVHPEFNPSKIIENQGLLSRWEEVQDRLHRLLELLENVSTGGITLSFLNRSKTVSFSKADLVNKEIRHDRIRSCFTNAPAGGTPILNELSKAFTAEKSTMVYLLTDGNPDPGTTNDVLNLIKKRNSKKFPLSLLSCTNDPLEWLEKADCEAEWVGTNDDYESEKAQVCEMQGPHFPYNKGIWLLCNLLSSICPYDLDALDEPYPLSKKGYQDYLGRNLTDDEYNNYLKEHPYKDKLTTPVINALKTRYITPQEIEKMLCQPQQRFFASSSQSTETYFLGHLSDLTLKFQLPKGFEGFSSFDKKMLYVQARLVFNSAFSLSENVITSTLKNNIWTQIESLHQEIHSSWPYPNKDRKRIKMTALCELLIGVQQTNNLSQSANNIKQKYGQSGLLDGTISQRTHKLFLEIDRECNSSSLVKSPGY